MARFAWAAWYAVAIFALGYVGSYLLFTEHWEVLPAWVTLGGSAVVAVAAGAYSAFED